MLCCRPACQEMQENATSAGLPLPQTGRPFYFVEVSEVPAKSASPLHALPPRAMYTRTSQVCTAQPQHAFPVIALPEDFWRMLLSGGSLLTETAAGKCSELEAHNLSPLLIRVLPCRSPRHACRHLGGSAPR